MTKKWIIRDTSGNLPTASEAEALRKALTQEQYTQRVWSATSPGDTPDGPLGRCEWSFEDGSEVTLVQSLEMEIESLKDSLAEVTWAKEHEEGKVERLAAELDRRPTVVDVLRAGYRLVMG